MKWNYIFGLSILITFIIIVTIILIVGNKEPFSNSVYGTATKLPKNDKLKNSKIALFMVATPEISNYAIYTIDVNKRWAQKHNYDFYLYEKSILPDLPINFSKIQYALNLLPKYDYVVYIDADAIIQNIDYDIRNVIAEYTSLTKSVIFAEDCFSAKDCSKPGKINSGVFIVKNNHLGKKVLESWLDASRGKCKKYVGIFPNCQNVFSYCVQEMYSFAINIIPFNIINGFENTLLIKHAMAKDSIDRIDELKKVYHTILPSERMHVW